MADPSDHPIAWPLALSAATIVGTLLAACMVPFVGLAVIAAATMSRPAALSAVVGTWLVNQLLGFGVLGYPLDAPTLGWGAALGLASVAAMLIARRVLGGRVRTALAVGAAFAVAFAGYELLLYAFALFAGGTETFAPAIVGQILANDAAWLVGLALLYLALTAAAPRWFGRTPALRLA